MTLMNELTSKQMVRSFFGLLYAGSPEAIAQLSPNYIEHQATAAFSFAGLQRYVTTRRAAYPGHQVIIHRTIAQDDLVFLHVEERLAPELTVARGELFRVADGAIAEHWSAHVLDRTMRRNSNGTFDGPDVNPGKHNAARYADEFQRLDERGFNHFDYDAFFRSRTARYIQHSPTGGDTVHGLVDVLQRIAALNIRMSMEVKRNLVEGDFIVSHRLYRTQPPFPDYKTMNVFDLFRITDEGQADEHWDIMEEIESEQHLAHIF